VLVTALRPAPEPPSSGAAAGSWSFAGSASGYPTGEASDWSAPASATTLADAAGVVSVWSGSAWVLVTPMKWTGSAWVPTPVVVYP
jgi:hypothetical protein